MKKKRPRASTSAPRAFSYQRFSSPEQMKGDSLRRQMAAVKAMAMRDGFALDEDLSFEDRGVSAHYGRNLEAGALGRFLELVRDGAIPRGSRLYVESLDRISRQRVRLAVRTMELLVEEGITVVDVMDGGRVYSAETLDNDDLAFLMMALRFIRAHEESTRKGVRIAEGWDAKRKSLSLTGKRSKPYSRIMPSWIRWNYRASRYELIVKRAAVVRKVFEKAAIGWNEIRIAAWLNATKVPMWQPPGRPMPQAWWSRYIRKMLYSAIAIGTFTPCISHRDELTRTRHLTPLDPVPHMYPAAVDAELFARVQAWKRRKVEARKKGLRTRSKVARYRGPQGELWAGYGRRPLWVHEALKQGAWLEDFAISRHESSTKNKKAPRKRRKTV